MEHEYREFSVSPLPPASIIDEINKTSRMVRYEVSEEMNNNVLKLFKLCNSDPRRQQDR